MTITLSDGTNIQVEQEEKEYGTVYNAETPVTESILNDGNLSDVTIDGVHKGYMILDFLSPDGLQFYLREPSQTEVAIHALQVQVNAQEGKIEELERKVAGDVTLTFTNKGPSVRGLFITTNTKDLMDETVPCLEVVFDDESSQEFVVNRLDIPSEFYLMNPAGAIADMSGEIHFKITEDIDTYSYDNISVVEEILPRPKK